MKKIALLLALVLLVLPITANAATPRIIGIKPGIAFDGTTANCTVSVTGETMKDKIEVVVKLWQGNRCIATWNASGTGFLNFSKTKIVTKGVEYTLTADVTINGTKYPTVSFTSLC